MKFELLGWWKANSDRYQVLSKMVKDVLAIPVSTIASKSVFSTKWCILNPFRSSLSPFMSQNLVFTQNWLQALVPISFRKSKDEVKALDDEFHDLGNMFNFQTSCLLSVIKCVIFLVVCVRVSILITLGYYYKG